MSYNTIYEYHVVHGIEKFWLNNLCLDDADYTHTNVNDGNGQFTPFQLQHLQRKHYHSEHNTSNECLCLCVMFVVSVYTYIYIYDRVLWYVIWRYCIYWLNVLYRFFSNGFIRSSIPNQTHWTHINALRSIVWSKPSSIIFVLLSVVCCLWLWFWLHIFDCAIYFYAPFCGSVKLRDLLLWITATTHIREMIEICEIAYYFGDVCKGYTFVIGWYLI